MNVPAGIERNRNGTSRPTISSSNVPGVAGTGRGGGIEVGNVAAGGATAAIGVGGVPVAVGAASGATVAGTGVVVVSLGAVADAVATGVAGGTLGGELAVTVVVGDE